jgi:hypothetical protein
MGEITKEGLKRILMGGPKRDALTVIGVVKTKEEIVDFLLTTKASLLEDGLTVLGWNFKIKKEVGGE